MGLLAFLVKCRSLWIPVKGSASGSGHVFTAPGHDIQQRIFMCFTKCLDLHCVLTINAHAAFA